MNENIDLTKILKDCPKGWKFYSSVYGEVEFVLIVPFSSLYTVIFERHGSRYSVSSTGEHFVGKGECTLFPSREQRDWSKFTAPWYKKDHPVIERIKTFEDACRELDKRAEGNEGIAFLLADYESNADNINSKEILAYMKLCIIAAALNEGWEPQFTEDEYRWYAWFTLLTEDKLKDKSEQWKADHKLLLVGGNSSNRSEAWLAYAGSSRGWTNSTAGLSDRLAVKSEELADYFGKQFIEIWADYVGPFNRKQADE